VGKTTKQKKKEKKKRLDTRMLTADITPEVTHRASPVMECMRACLVRATRYHTIAEAAEAVLVECVHTTAPVAEFPLTALAGPRTPLITLAAYIGRFVRHCQADAVAIVAALALVDRLAQLAGDWIVLPTAVHRTFAASAKCNDDHYFSNNHYARVAGLPMDVLAAAELELLWRCGYRVVIDADMYEAYAATFLRLVTPAF
jgi:hypothetical protein